MFVECIAVKSTHTTTLGAHKKVVLLVNWFISVTLLNIKYFLRTETRWP